MGHFAAAALNNQIVLGILCYVLIFAPILGMWAVHHYGWEHWQPFDKGHK